MAWALSVSAQTLYTPLTLSHSHTPQSYDSEKLSAARAPARHTLHFLYCARDDGLKIPALKLRRQRIVPHVLKCMLCGQKAAFLG